MDLSFNFIDFIEASGGMYNAVEYLRTAIKEYVIFCKSISLNFNYHGIDSISHRVIDGDEYDTQEGDSVGMDIMHLGYSYGYIRRQKPNWLILYVEDYHNNLDDFISDIQKKISIKQQKREELNVKRKEIDPFSEEDWLDESFIIKDFEKFKRIV
jgi:hypothetical protein